MTPPLWVQVLEACDNDPLLAQECDTALGEIPGDLLRALLVASNGNPVRARKILDECNAVWWHRWLKVMELRHDANEE